MNIRKLTSHLVLFAALLPVVSPASDRDSHWQGVDRIVAVGDVHGDHDQLTELLGATGLVGDDGHWNGGEAHLVVAGDAVDRGDQSREVLDLLMRLEREAAGAGGKVHVLLGNHEAMWLTGDLEYTTVEDLAAFTGEETQAMRQAARERYEQLQRQFGNEPDFDEHFPPGSLALRAAMKPDGQYGRWLMQRPVAVVINDTAFVHGGLSESWAGMDAGEINERAGRESAEILQAWQRLDKAGIVAAEYPLLDASRALSAHLESGALDGHPPDVQSAARTLARAPESVLFDPAGPLWYRGNATCNPLAESAALYQALDGLGAGSLVISHTPVAGGRISARLDGRLVRIDTGGRGGALVITPDARRAVYAGLEGEHPVTQEDRHPVANVPMSAPEIETFLAEARVESVEDVGTGVTNPKRVTLVRGDVHMRAIFKTESTQARSTGRFASRRLNDVADRHQYELAAYRLDRMLGLNMVPPAVERRIGRDTGTLQYWVEDAMNERQRRHGEVKPDPACPLARDYALLELFDRLIYNTDRTQENILYLPDWRVALIDHTRAFRTSEGRPEGVRHVSPAEAPGFAERLRDLDDERLRDELGDLLDRSQLRALAERRDEILAEWRESGSMALADR